MPNILITGANRGIGLAFVRRAAAEGWRVHAACRAPESAGELQGVAGDVSVHRLDVADPAAIEVLARGLSGTPIDILLNNAGVLAPGSFGQIDYDAWLDSFRVNTLGPMKMTECFLPHLMEGARRLVVCISSIMGSIARSGGGSYPYRTSKAALNMVVKGLAADLGPRGVTVVAFHPGWVRTDMGGASASLTPDQSVRRLWRRIERLDISDNGAFLDPDGAPIPW